MDKEAYAQELLVLPPGDQRRKQETTVSVVKGASTSRQVRWAGRLQPFPRLGFSLVVFLLLMAHPFLLRFRGGG